jgi:hypothetical protein
MSRQSDQEREARIERDIEDARGARALRGDEDPVVDLEQLIKDERAQAGDAGGIGGDAVARDTDAAMLLDDEQREPLFESTIANPDPVPNVNWAPEGIESLGEFSRDAADAADAFIDDLPDDPDDVTPAG